MIETHSVPKSTLQFTANVPRSQSRGGAEGQLQILQAMMPVIFSMYSHESERG